jgi:hypothetical protein
MSRVGYDLRGNRSGPTVAVETAPADRRARDDETETGVSHHRGELHQEAAKSGSYWPRRLVDVCLRGEDFSIEPYLTPDEISPDDAEAKARKLCERLRLEVLDVEISPVPPPQE